MIQEDKAKALESLTIGCWINGLWLLNPKDVENYETQVLVRIWWLVDNWRPSEQANWAFEIGSLARSWTEASRRRINTKRKKWKKYGSSSMDIRCNQREVSFEEPNLKIEMIDCLNYSWRRLSWLEEHLRLNGDWQK
jgi:hypothetical protein